MEVDDPERERGGAEGAVKPGDADATVPTFPGNWREVSSGTLGAWLGHGRPRPRR
jgi:hypothetical protein